MRKLICIVLFLVPLTTMAEFDERTLEFESRGATFAARILVPSGKPPYPAIVMVHGSGEMSFEGLYRAHAAMLGELGFVVMFFDKRGTGGSEGEYHETPPTLRYYGDDVVAALNIMREQPEVGDLIGLWGISQGGWIGTHVIATEPVSFFINVSGPGVAPWRQVPYQQAQRAVREYGLSEDAFEPLHDALLAGFEYWATGNASAGAAGRYNEIASRPWFAAFPYPAELVNVQKLPEGLRNFVSTPFMRFEPAPVMVRSCVPVLVIYGDRDWQIPVQASIAAIKSVQSQATCSDVDIAILENVDHDMMSGEAPGEGELSRAYRAVVENWSRRFVY